ncbi:MAG TPA: hypothetical protein DEA94_15300 [Rhodobacteraceae bacterium]|nr:hypothetical protein [Paracoccaceae bacterium]
MVYNQPKPSDKYRKSRRWVDKEQGLYGTYFQLEDEIFCVIIQSLAFTPCRFCMRMQRQRLW